MSDDARSGYYSTRPEKNKELSLLRIAQGDDPVLAVKAQNTLLKENEGFLKFMVESWVKGLSGYDFDLIMQDARLAFMLAIRKFDLTRDVSIRTYSQRRLQKVKQKYLEKKNLLRFDDWEVMEKVAAPLESGTFQFDLRSIISDALEKSLNPDEQEVINLYFIEGMKKSHIAQKKNCSKTWVQTLIKGALPKVKIYLITKGISPILFDFN